MAKKKTEPTIQIEQVPVASLIEYASNARTHSPEQVKQIAASITEFTFTNPVLIDANNELVAGHGRVMAAKELGMESVPCIRLGHLTPEQVRAYRLADNKIALNSGWDEAKLKAEIEALQKLDFDVQLTGFSSKEIEKLIEKIAPKSLTLTDAQEQILNSAWVERASEFAKHLGENKSGPLSPFHTEATAEIFFLRSLFLGEAYPRYLSVCFQPHQMSVVGAQRSLVDLFKLVAAGDIKPERLRFLARDNGSLMNVMASGMPCAGCRIPMDFPALFAMQEINAHCKSGRVLDPCHGWGGRAVGFLLSDAVKYCGYDTDKRTNDGVARLLNRFGKHVPDKSWNVHNAPFEQSVIEPASFDFALTCPPYFDVEKYEGENTSRITFDTFEKWADGFLRVIFEKTFDAVKAGGAFSIILGNQTYDLESPAMQFAAESGWTFTNKESLSLSNAFHETEEDDTETVYRFHK